MKTLPWILVVLLIAVCLGMYFHTSKQPDAQTMRDTITRIDTVWDTVPVPSKEQLVRVDTVYLPLLVGDTALGDSVPVAIPITQKEYKTNQYQAWVSGYRPNLDSLHTFIPTTTIYVKQKTKRWGIGLQVGYGYPCRGYVGIGANYNIFRW